MRRQVNESIIIDDIRVDDLAFAEQQHPFVVIAPRKFLNVELRKL